MLNALVSTLAFALAAAPQAGSDLQTAEASSSGTQSDKSVQTAAPAPETSANKPVVFADKTDEAVADDVISYLEGLTTLSGDFVQTAPNGSVASGDFFLRRPGQVRFDYDDPSPITIVATGGLVYVENADLETTDSYPLKKTPLRFLLNKKIDLGDAVLKSVVRGADALAVTFASEDEEAEGEITLVLAAPKLSIAEWAIRDPNGGLTVVSLQGVVAGQKLENRMFRAPDAGGAFINN
ncbi:MAG: outer membrane lipoprotein carrier protein LolA [Parvularculaceae bacterium]|nr:outer membrane lipoprotein carrier protein LolA [Parvularculaceae bacterium]